MLATLHFRSLSTDNTADTWRIDTSVSCKDRLHSNTLHNVSMVPSAWPLAWWMVHTCMRRCHVPWGHGWQGGQNAPKSPVSSSIELVTYLYSG